MKHQEISAFCGEQCGNNNYISLNTRPDLIDAVMDHPEYSHISLRDNSYCVYFHCENSPTRVWLTASIRVENAQPLLSKLDALTKAINCI